MSNNAEENQPKSKIDWSEVLTYAVNQSLPASLLSLFDESARHGDLGLERVVPVILDVSDIHTTKCCWMNKT